MSRTKTIIEELVKEHQFSSVDFTNWPEVKILSSDNQVCIDLLVNELTSIIYINHLQQCKFTGTVNLNFVIALAKKLNYDIHLVDTSNVKFPCNLKDGSISNTTVLLFVIKYLTKGKSWYSNFEFEHENIEESNKMKNIGDIIKLSFDDLIHRYDSTFTDDKKSTDFIVNFLEETQRKMTIKDYVLNIVRSGTVIECSKIDKYHSFFVEVLQLILKIVFNQKNFDLLRHINQISKLQLKIRDGGRKKRVRSTNRKKRRSNKRRSFQWW